MCSKPLDAPMPVVLCVLAAGLSRRMGAVNKLLLDYSGQPLVRHVVQQAVEAAVGKVHVVTGYQAGDVRRALDGLPVHYVHNPDYEEGLASSVRQAASINDSAALMVLLGDMPGVTAPVIRRLVQALRQSAGQKDVSHRVVRPVHEGRPGNPVLWGTGWLPRLRQLTGDEGARTLLAGYTGPVLEVEARSRGIFADVDDPSDLPGFGMHLPG